MTVAVHRDLVTARPTGYRPLALDLYVPPQPRALCLYLHGGGWRLGSRRDGPGPAARWEPSFFEHVAGLGVAVASVDYRLSGEARYPAQQDDLAAAHRFLVEHADRFGLATERTTVWGVSAGGQLAAMHALRPPDDLPPLAAAVCWYAPTDLGGLAGDVAAVGGGPDRSASSREGLLIGAGLDERPELARAASPLYAVGEQPPPFLFVHGGADVNVPLAQSQRMAGALRARGGQAEIDVVPGGTHIFSGLDDDATRALVRRSVRFILGS